MGDPDQVVVYQREIHVDAKTHELVLDTHQAKSYAEDLKGEKFSHVSLEHNTTEAV